MAETSSTTTHAEAECGVLVAATKVAQVLDLLKAMPMDLPEPSISSYSDLPPSASWIVDETTARRIVAFLGHNDWHVSTYDDAPQTIAMRYINGTYDAKDLLVSVVVDGINLPDLAVEPAPAVSR